MQNQNKISLPEHNDLDSLLCLRLRESPSHSGHRGLWRSLFQPLAQSRSSNEICLGCPCFYPGLLESLPEASSFPGLPVPLLAGQHSSSLFPGGPPQNLLQFFHIFPVLWWVQNWTHGARCGLQSAKSQLKP